MTRAQWMKRMTIVFVFIGGTWLGSAALGQSLDPFDAPWDDRAVFAGSLVTEEQGVLEGLPGATVYRMKILIADDYRTLNGVEDVLYTNCENVELNELAFRLFPNVAGGSTEILALNVDEMDAIPAFSSSGSTMRIPLDEPLSPGDAVQIHVAFRVDIPTEPGPWGPFGFVGGILSLDAFYPMIPIYDDGWIVPDVPPQGDWTSLDAGFYLVEVTAPSALVMAASGVEVSRDVDDGHQTVTYAIGPARDFYLAGSERFTTYSETHGEVTITHYFFPGGERQAETVTIYTKRMLDTYAGIFGPYPYTEFDVVTSFLQNGSAMEYPGIIAETIDIYDRSVVYFGVVRSQTMFEIGLAHEGAHQWFYNVVGNDQVNEPWLDEAIAQYSSFLYYDAKAPYLGRNYQRDWWDLKWERVDHEEVPIGLSCGAYTRENYGPIIYGRAPYFFDALADALNMETAGEFLRAYYEQHRWGVATTASLRAVAEELCGCDLSELFDTWVYANDEE